MIRKRIEVRLNGNVHLAAVLVGKDAIAIDTTRLAGHSGSAGAAILVDTNFFRGSRSESREIFPVRNALGLAVFIGACTSIVRSINSFLPIGMPCCPNTTTISARSSTISGPFAPCNHYTFLRKVRNATLPGRFLTPLQRASIRRVLGVEVVGAAESRFCLTETTGNPKSSATRFCVRPFVNGVFRGANMNTRADQTQRAQHHRETQAPTNGLVGHLKSRHEIPHDAGASVTPVSVLRFEAPDGGFSAFERVRKTSLSSTAANHPGLVGFCATD